MVNAVTSGSLSNVTIYDSYIELIEDVNYEKIINDVAPQFEIVQYDLNQESVLIKSKDNKKMDTNVLRAVLHELQEQSRRSFVALINPVNQYALITIRG